MAAERGYVCFFYVGDDHDEVRFASAHRAGSKGNCADALTEIRRRKGRYIADRAEIARIHLERG